MMTDSDKKDWVTIIGASLIVLFVGILVLRVALAPDFHYQQKVKVVDGFYSGATGTVQRCVFFGAEYDVDTGGAFDVTVSAYHLEAIENDSTRK